MYTLMTNRGTFQFNFVKYYLIIKSSLHRREEISIKERPAMEAS